MALPPALVLCCSKAGLAVARALGVHGVEVIGVWYGRSRLVTSSRFVKSCHRSPDPENDASGFVEFLCTLAGTLGGSVIFPTDDASLLAVSREKERLSRDYRVVAEDWSIVRRLLEKHLTYEIAHALGVPAPRVEVIRSADQAIALARQVGYPCLIKPSVGHAFFTRYRAKMFVVRSEQELRHRLGELEGYAGELMLSEFIPGDDTSGVNYNAFFADAAPFCEFTARKVRVKPRRIGFPTVVRSADVPEVMDYGRRLLGDIGYRGFACTEFKKDRRDGVYKLMEVNGRHNFSGMLALRCGVNFPWLSFTQAIAGELPTPATEYRKGIYWIDEERDIKGLASSLFNGLGATRAYLDPYLHKPVFAVFSADDPLPTFRQLAETIPDVFTRRRRSNSRGAMSAAKTPG